MRISRNSGYSSDSEQKKQDLSVLRKPIYTALFGFLEAKRAFDNGTEEIRKLLCRECDIMYECKICKNIFRSLTNFISHKRVYCRNTFSSVAGNSFNRDRNGFVDRQTSTIIQTEQDNANSSNQVIKNLGKTGENSSKDLSSVIEKLLKREQVNQVLTLTDFYDQVGQKLAQDEVGFNKHKHILQLDTVPDSQVAVYQTIKRDDNDNIKKEATEVHELLAKNWTIGPDGVAQIHTTQKMEQLNCATKGMRTDLIACKICKLNFSTEKTLKLHLQTKHIKSTYVYQCPSCSLTFLQPKAVIRHLGNDHKKTTRRIRLMRESILKRRVRIDDVQHKGPSRELSRLQLEVTANKLEKNERDSNTEGSKCVFCDKSFDRKAVLASHLNRCSKKKKIKNKVTSSSVAIRSNANGGRKSGYDLHSVNEICDFEQSLNAMHLSSEESIANRSRRKQPQKSVIKNETMENERIFSNEMFWSENSQTDSLNKLKNAINIKSEFGNKFCAIERDAKLKEISNKHTIRKIVKKSGLVQPSNVEAVQQEKIFVHNSVKKPRRELSCHCKICGKKFNALSNLRRHISMFHYRRRKFGCTKCDYRGFRKYDIINHLTSVHGIIDQKEKALEYISVHESEKNEENIDDDIVITDEKECKNADVLNKKVHIAAPIKRRRRRTRKQNEPASLSKTEISDPLNSLPNIVPENFKTKPLSTKMTRSSSSNLAFSNDFSHATKRPIRHRIKPVKKDFVYDLSNLLKKDMVLSEKNSTTLLVPARPMKRRTTSLYSKSFDEQIRELVLTSPGQPIRGAAQLMAELAVTKFQACFNKPPDIPRERPMIPSRALTLSRLNSVDIEMECKHFINNTDDSENGMTTKAESFISTLAKRRKLNLNNRPSVSLNSEKKVSTSSSSEQIDLLLEEEKIIEKFTSENDFQEYLIVNKLMEPVKKFTSPLCAEIAANERSLVPIAGKDDTKNSIAQQSITVAKRITLMQRIAENKSKKLQQDLFNSSLGD